MNVVFLPAAEHDLGDIVSYIRENIKNPIAARNIATKILQRVQALENVPDIGAKLRSIDPRFSDYRSLVFDDYLVVYSIGDSEIRIMCILYAQSDYIQLLQG